MQCNPKYKREIQKSILHKRVDFLFALFLMFGVDSLFLFDIISIIGKVIVVDLQHFITNKKACK